MAMGKRTRDRQPAMWVATTELPTSASHPFYARLNQLLSEHRFDDFAEAQCAGFYAKTMGRPGLAPGIYFRLLLVGHFGSGLLLRNSPSKMLDYSGSRLEPRLPPPASQRDDYAEHPTEGDADWQVAHSKAEDEAQHQTEPDSSVWILSAFRHREDDSRCVSPSLGGFFGFRFDEQVDEIGHIELTNNRRAATAPNPRSPRIASGSYMGRFRLARTV